MIRSTRDKVGLAVIALLNNHAELFVKNVAEQAITHQFATCLKRHFPEMDVDCEYNRNLNTVKQLCYERRGDYALKNVVPDIIIHRRGTNTNLLVVEVKKTTNSLPDQNEIDRLHTFIDQLGYTHAAFFRFIAGRDVTGVEKEVWLP